MARLLAALFFAALLGPTVASAQSVTLFVDPFPSPYVADWEVQAGIFQVMVMNGPVEQELVMVLAVLDAQGATILEATSHPEYFSANETRAFNSVSELGGTVDYDSGYGDNILRTGRLPEGEFRLCVRLEDALGTPVAPEECVDFTILFPDPPYLLTPFDEDLVRTDNPLFQWTPLQTPVGLPIHFRLQIAEILEGQTPFEALTSNVLHFDGDDITFESFEYPIGEAPFEEGTNYAWWVQALDDEGLAATANLGRSEIWTFSYASEDIELIGSGDPQSLRLVSADQASGPLTDYDTMSFDAVVREVNTLTAAGAGIEIPLALDGDFEPISIAGVQIYIDTQLKSLAIRGERQIRGKTYDVMFTTHWGTRADPRSKALAIKGEEFDGFFPVGGLLDDLATSQAWFIIACGNHTLKSAELPPEVRDYYGDEEIGAKLGLNLWTKVIAKDSPWVNRVCNALNTDQAYLELHGFIGPKIGAVFDTSGEMKIEMGGETALTATLPLWRPKHFDDVITRMQGELEIGAGLGYNASSDSTGSGSEAKLSAQVAIKAGVTFPFLKNTAQLADEVGFTGALKIEKELGKDGVALSLALSPDDVVDLPALENVISLHDPTVTFSYQTGEAKPAVAFSAKADVGRYRNAAEFKVQLASVKQSAEVKPDTTSTGETPPPGGVPTPFKQAELLAKEKERKEAAKKKPRPSREGEWSAEVKFDATALGAIRPRELLKDLFNFGGNLGLLPDGPEFQSLSITFLPQTPGSMVVAGSALFLNSPVHFIASRMKSMDGGSSVLFGVAPHEWSFKDAFPEAEIPLLSELEISNVGLLFATDEFIASSDDLHGEQYGFYQVLYGRDDFMVNIRPGVNLIASLPVEGMDPDSPLIPIMDKLGVQRGPALIQGAFGTSIKDMYFRASLPPLSPPGAPEWFEYGQLDVELTGQPSIALIGTIAVNIEDDLVLFFVKTKAGREGVVVAGGIEAPGGWHGPFGVDWMTLNRTVLLLGITPTGSLQMGFEGDLEIGESDVRVAVLAAINLATGVPTNFMVDGESENGVSVADLLALQAAIASARQGAPVEPIPSDKLPLLGVEDLKLKFAPKDSPELNIERGLAIGGMLNMQPAPEEPADLIAAAEFDVGDDGLVARAAIGDFEIGPVALSNTAMDLTLTRAEQYFRLSGDADLTIMRAAIDVDLALTEMTFDAEGEAFGLFMADIRAVGRANLTDPQFTVLGELRNDFKDEAAREIIAEALADAEERTERALLDREAAIAAHQRAAREARSARSAWLNTPAFPRQAKKAARNRMAWKARGAWLAGIARARRTTAAGVWIGVRTTLRAADAAAGIESPVTIRVARFDGDLSRMGSGEVAKLDLELEVEGEEIKVSSAGFNFRDMGPGLKDAARQVVDKIFRGRA